MKAAGNIILVGFMGTGKSSVGRILAQRLGRELVDMDAAIEARERRPIADIFANEGETHFRKLERALVQELSARQELVIAPGGGAILNPDNIHDFENSGLLVCLRASPEEILRRVRGETHRPLLETGDKEQRVRELYARRKPLYEGFTHQVNTEGLTPEQVADRVLALYQQACVF